MKPIVALLLAVVLLVSCDVEFSPNAEWKEIPVVYCVLDQDDDTSTVRVQKCYLGNDNLMSYSTIYDSINFPQGSISVQILKYPARRDGGVLVKTGAAPTCLEFSYALRNKEEGNFASPMQPVYQRATKGELDEEAIYQLLVIKTATGDTIASATTTLVSWTKDKAFYFDKPTKFNFLPAHKCDFRWNAFTEARLYQPKVRYYYLIQETISGTDSVRTLDTSYVDILCPRVRNINNSAVLNTSLSESTFLLDMKNALKETTTQKGFYDTCEVFMYVCNEELTAYINSTDIDLTGSQERQTYTNIQGGVGIFGSRRTHIKTTMPADGSVGNDRLHGQLKKLNIGF